MGKSLIIKGADFSVNGIAPEFTQLKCIVSTATTQAIKSIVDFPANGQIIASMATPSTTGTGFGNIFGKEYNSTVDFPKNFYFTQFNNFNSIIGCLYYVNVGASYKNINNGFQDGNMHTITLDRTGGRIDNGSKVTAEEQTTTSSIPKDYFGIFGRCNGSNSFIVNPGIKCYGVKILSDRDNPNSIIMDAIPVKRLSDNAICLYDKISGEYLLTEDGTNPDYEELD